MDDRIAVAMADVADLAAVLVGVLAILATVGVARVTSRLQATQIEQARYDELTEVLLEINRILPTLITDPNAYAVQGQTLRFLATRAEHLVRDLRPDRVTAFDLLSLAHAFGQVSDVNRANEFFGKAEAAARDHLPDLVSVLSVRAHFNFGVPNVPAGRAAYRTALEKAKLWRDEHGDVARDASLSILLFWAGLEHQVPDVRQREVCMAQAREMIDEFDGEWRRQRGRQLFDQARAAFDAAQAGPAAPSPAAPETPAPPALGEPRMPDPSVPGG